MAEEKAAPPPWPEGEEETGPKVTVETYFRESDGRYAILAGNEGRRDGVEIVDMTSSLGWCFPDGSASLDKVTIDGQEYTGGALDTPMKDTAVKEGSVVQVYKTAMGDEDED